ncbi:MAG: TGS domain-containing protein [Candidatus Aenigmarchaeota archaeon]|nr:TGS domain-containing protein [Candidatus Aenigmarchaeota archaeon]
MPVNPPAEYYKAEMKYAQAKNREEKIAALEEMISLLPRHHGSENAHAQLKSRLAKLKKEGEKKGTTKVGIQKEGDAQVCLLGYTNSGKSQLLAAITDAKPEIAPYEYTTVKPEIGMMDWKGVKIQIIEIPSTFEPAYVSIARTAELVIIVIKNPKEEKMLRSMLDDKYIRTKSLTVNPREETPSSVKERIWKALGRIVVYTKKTKTPMSLARGATVRDAAKAIHKDFIKNFRFARIGRKGMNKQVGLGYTLDDGDVIEIYA